MRLKHLTPNKLVDVAYWCGVEGTPVSMIIAAPPGSGKTWSTKSIEDIDFVQYIDKVYSPNEHRKVIAAHGSRTKLFINDDIGMFPKHRRSEYFNTMIMVIDGELQYTVWKTNLRKVMDCSVVLCCTTDSYYDFVDDMKSCGLYDRIVPIVLGLSRETRNSYQERIYDEIPLSRKPPIREPDVIIKSEIKTNMLHKKNIDPRLLMNIIFMSQYLTEDELAELIAVAHSNGKYEL